MKKQFRTAMLSTACMLIVAVMSLTGVTYAWFTTGEKATVTGMNVTVDTADGGILVSSNGTDWQQTLALADVNKTSINPISTIDAVNFYTAVFSKTDNTKLITTSATSSDLSENTIVQDLWLTTDSAKDVQINLAGTFFYDVANGEDGAATSIGQAARIAIFKYGTDGTSTTLLGILAPYSAKGDGSDIAANEGSYIGVKGATPAEGVVNTTADGTYFANVTVVAPTADAVTITLPGTETEGATSVKIKIVIWLEGQDEQCSNPNAGGAFNTFLSFTKVAEQ